MRRILGLMAVLVALCAGGLAFAQEQVWVQIEAQPDEAQGRERAAAYAGAFPDVQGFRLRSGWYAILLGPYDRPTAQARLSDLKRENLIPRDSFISDGGSHLDQFWPAPGLAPGPDPAPEAEAIPETPATPETTVAEPAAEPEPATDPAEAPEPLAPAASAEAAAPPVVTETPEEARASEAALSDEGRQDLQRALQWFGFYDGAIDGAFGRGTRGSMAAWQEANDREPTGILTTAERAELVGAWQDETAAFGFQTVTEGEAGIEIALPLAMVGFDHYEPPFVHYTPRAGSDLRIILVSQPGDEAGLKGLYDLMQKLAVVPAEGERSLTDNGFTIEGRSATTVSYTRVVRDKGFLKGWMAIWPPALDPRMARILPTLQASFRPVGDRALDPGMVPLDEATRQGLMAGLEIRRPKLSRSGFFVDAAGTVVTTTEAVDTCTRVTLEGETPAEVVLADPALGLAVLRPQTAVAPRAVAALRAGPTRLGAQVAVAGFPWEDRMPAPVLTFGSLDSETGLDGEADLRRLTLDTRSGDAGGAVLDASGAVLGMVLPRRSGDRLLPAGAALALSADTIAARLAAQGVTAQSATSTLALPPDDLTARATGLAVLVSCWD